MFVYLAGESTTIANKKMTTKEGYRIRRSSGLWIIDFFECVYYPTYCNNCLSYLVTTTTTLVSDPNSPAIRLHQAGGWLRTKKKPRRLRFHSNSSCMSSMYSTSERTRRGSSDSIGRHGSGAKLPQSGSPINSKQTKANMTTTQNSLTTSDWACQQSPP